MADTSDYVTLQVNGIRYLEKAPYLYWLTATSYRIFGQNEFATRLPVAFGVLACTVLSVVWAQRAFGRRAAEYSGLFVLTAIGMFLFTRIMIPESWLSFLLFATLYFFLTALHFGPGKYGVRWYAGYAFLALAALTKGLVALVFIGATAFFYLLITGEWRRAKEFRIPSGLLLMFAIAAPWHILAGERNPGFYWFYFVNEHFLRFTGERYPKDYNKLPAWAFWTMHIAWLFPWSLYLPVAVRELWRKFRMRRFETFEEKTRLICAIYGGLVLLFFSLGTNQEYYTFPAYLPLLMLIASSLAAEENASGKTSRWITAEQIVLVAFGTIAAGALVAGLWTSRNLPYVQDIGEVLARRGVGDYTLSMSSLFDLTNEAFAALRLPAALAAIALLVGPIVAFVLRNRRKHLLATWSVGLTAAAFLIAAQIGYVRFEPQLSSKRMAVVLNREMQPSDKLLIYGDQAFGASLRFYTKRQILLVNGRTNNMWFGSSFPDALNIFLDDDQLLALWNGADRIFLFAPEQHRQEVEQLLPAHRVEVVVSSGKVIYSNR